MTHKPAWRVGLYSGGWAYSMYACTVCMSAQYCMLAQCACGCVLHAVGSPHDPQILEGGGGGPSRWPNGSVALTNNLICFIF